VTAVEVAVYCRRGASDRHPERSDRRRGGDGHLLGSSHHVQGGSGHHRRGGRRRAYPTLTRRLLGLGRHPGKPRVNLYPWRGTSSTRHQDQRALSLEPRPSSYGAGRDRAPHGDGSASASDRGVARAPGPREPCRAPYLGRADCHRRRAWLLPPGTSLDLAALVDRWSRSGAEEPAGEDLLFPGLCDLFGGPRPGPRRPPRRAASPSSSSAHPARLAGAHQCVERPGSRRGEARAR
jgi:hypothetical protein